jgi:hypothetical protein
VMAAGWVDERRRTNLLLKRRSRVAAAAVVGRRDMCMGRAAESERGKRRSTADRESDEGRADGMGRVGDDEQPKKRRRKGKQLM